MKTKAILIIMLLGFFLNGFSQVLFKKQDYFMGSVFVIAFIDTDIASAEQKYQQVRQRIIEIENKISSWKSSSETSAINNNAGIQPVIVSKDLFYLIKRTKKISELTDGYFDISYAALDKIWKFDGSSKNLPDSNLVNTYKNLVNYKNIILDETKFSVFLKNKGMRIGFGAIGKGYAANQSKQLLLELGIENGLIDAGGDLIAWGKDENKENWKIALKDPRDKYKSIANFDITDRSVVTSGNYEKYIEVDGLKYSHIINPRTAWPALGVKSVSIFCSDAEVADGLATAVFIMGVDKGLKLVNNLKNIETLIIDKENQIHVSNHLELK